MCHGTTTSKILVRIERKATFQVGHSTRNVVGGGDDIVTHGMLRPKRMIRTSNLHSSAIKTLRMRPNSKTFVQQIITTTNLIQSVHDSTTRGHNYKIFKPHSQCLTRSIFFSNRVINDWNSLPTNIVNANSINFKSLLDEHWKNSFYNYL